MKLLPLALLLLFAAIGPANATSSAESQFVRRASSALLALYPTTDRATSQGYVKMRNLDKDNTIIYTNFEYRNITPKHPNFLWFDRNGKLVGVDYEFPTSAWPNPPIALYPVARSKWVTIDEHVHFAYTLDGNTVLHGGPALPDLKQGTITLAALQADKLVPPGAKLLWADYHPACWDLGFWVVPNPAGPFAEKNSLVN